MVKPRAIEKGDAFGIVAPGGPVAPDELRDGIELIKASGYSVILARNIFNINGYLAGDDRARLQGLHEMFLDARVKAIMCARGGYGSLRLLDKLDYGLVQKNPKVFIGYSDITALLLSFYRRTGLITFHGPVLREICGNNQEDWLSLQRVISDSGETKLDLSGSCIMRPGKAAGPLLGGNLSLVCHMVGTPFMPSLKGKVLFLEEKGEAPYRLDRMLTHLRLSGEFERVSGILLGSFVDCGDPSYLKEMFSEMFSCVGGPVVMGIPSGHGPENITIPIGIEAKVDTEKRLMTAAGAVTAAK